MFNSQYYTCEQIDQRLLQGYVDDYNNNNSTNLTKAELLTALYNFLTQGLRTGDIVQSTGNAENKVMSQKAVTDEFNLLRKRPWKHFCATNWFSGKFKVVYDSTNHTISTVVTISSDCYLWFENGSILIPLRKLAATFEVPNTVSMKYLYAIQNTVGDDPAIFLTESFGSIPDNAVIIDIFYTWGWNGNIKAFWTSDFIPHEGFPNEYANGSVSYFNPKAVYDLINEGGSYIGILTPSSNPGNHLVKVFAFANQKGTYTNLLDSGGNPIVIPIEGLNVLSYTPAQGGTHGYWTRDQIYRSDRVFDGGRADTVYGGARSIICGGAADS